ncbi:E3 ubiquitin-protein ligase MARCH11 isoform X1 [Cinnamomum micranthum f. kanehirae]|uniref:E3 ubiquitin-protein ligase MARCH11 isoform X1 n=1 Tax=Cinnamomum micranthum f. kanehirae TaxID=337451 RepID=A0A3S3N721_9MAGN|nr:E3 ubiquitin-protein ligase MARCH11 isoform X1 [Cinnamomum micranthum f. kanehirae]
MQKDGTEGDGIAGGEFIDCSSAQKQEKNGGASSRLQEDSVDREAAGVISIVVSRGDACNQVPAVSELKGNVTKTSSSEKDVKADAVPLKKGCLSRSESDHEECRVCQQQSEEPLMDLGCQCRGELAKAHRSCIEIWFRTRGSNKCEICQQVATNVPPPESQPSAGYWTWRVEPAFGGSAFVQGERERGCFSPLWIAFSILIGGLLLDVLISISLGVSALPVNIIIGVLVVLGLGTALRLALECCHEWSLRREVHRVDPDIIPGYHPTV